MSELSSMRVMVVDDTEANIDVLIETLGNDYKVVVAMDGESALEDIKRYPPDLILLDIMMPSMDGYEVCKKLKEDKITRDIPLIFLTALKEEGDEARGLELGAIDYITKPFNPDLVKARVRNHLELKRHKNHLEELVHAKTLEIVEHQRLEFQLRSAKEKIENELSIASQIQNSFLPSTLRSNSKRGEFDLHAVMTPAREVGGDFYDFFWLNDTNLVLIIADVSDKSIPAALYMMVSRTMFRSLSRQIKSPAKVLAEANNLICEENETGMFITAFLAYYNMDSGTMSFANAGHHPAILLESSGAMQVISHQHGMALGIMPMVDYIEASVQLVAGQTVFLYTDGVTEALSPHGELFGTTRLNKLLNQSAGLDLSQLLIQIDASLKEFQQGHQHDDITMLALKKLR
jgi:sigma-B regulation protein RsbU (phosphoserine phosphatase)